MRATASCVTETFVYSVCRFVRHVSYFHRAESQQTFGERAVRILLRLRVEYNITIERRAHLGRNDHATNASIVQQMPHHPNRNRRKQPQDLVDTSFGIWHACCTLTIDPSRLYMPSGPLPAIFRACRDFAEGEGNKTALFRARAVVPNAASRSVLIFTPSSDCVGGSLVL